MLEKLGEGEAESAGELITSDVDCLCQGADILITPVSDAPTCLLSSLFYFFRPSLQHCHKPLFILCTNSDSHKPLLAFSLIRQIINITLKFLKGQVKGQVKGQNRTDLGSMHFLCLHGYGTNKEV